jgi:restriction modification system DNA specificity domain protein
MARAKKETALTLEERLQAALVPDWEWPYKLPENWCWLKLVESFDNHTDSKKKIKQKDYLVKGKLAVVDQGQELIGGYTNDVEKSYSGALPIVIFGDHTRCIKFVDFPFAQGADGVKVLRPKPFYLPKAFYYALQSVNIPNLGYRRHFPLFNKFSIPLPPFAEQQRIVDRIESLFAKLDEAKEKAQTVVDSFETRKATILHKAFTGELTKKWRKSANTRWVYKKIKDCCKLGSGGTPSRKVPDFYKGDIPWIKTGEIEWNDIYDTEEKITQSAIDNSSARCYKPGVVLVAMYGMGVTRGKASILRVQAATNQAVCVLEPQSALLYNRYLLYYFMRNYWDIREKAVGGNQLNLSLTIIKELNIEIPPIDEQMKIVQILDNLFAKEQQTKEAAEAVLDQINLMKKSILARAFRGELGTNDPSEESAVELLKQII